MRAVVNINCPPTIAWAAAQASRDGTGNHERSGTRGWSEAEAICAFHTPAYHAAGSDVAAARCSKVPELLVRNELLDQWEQVMLLPPHVLG